MKDYYTPLKPLHEAVKRAIQNNRVVPATNWYNEFHDKETLFI